MTSAGCFVEFISHLSHSYTIEYSYMVETETEICFRQLLDILVECCSSAVIGTFYVGWILVVTFSFDYSILFIPCIFLWQDYLNIFQSLSVDINHILWYLSKYHFIIRSTDSSWPSKRQSTEQLPKRVLPRQRTSDRPQCCSRKGKAQWREWQILQVSHPIKKATALTHSFVHWWPP